MKKEKYFGWNIQEKLTSGKVVTIHLLKPTDWKLLSDFFENIRKRILKFTAVISIAPKEKIQIFGIAMVVVVSRQTSPAG